MDTTDKFLFLGLGIDIFVLVGYCFGLLPEWAVWLGIGMAFGTVLVSLIDALRRSLDLW